jgi:hypothetical protein
MNRILNLLKGKSLKGLGKLSRVAWLFKIDDEPDKDVISVRGVPEVAFLSSGGSCMDPELETLKPQKPEVLKGEIEIE